MTEIINLNKARKAAKKQAKAGAAIANRALHGRTAAEKAAEEQAKAQAKNLLDGARLVRDEDVPS
jgi:hypothetical protein